MKSLYEEMKATYGKESTVKKRSQTAKRLALQFPVAYSNAVITGDTELIGVEYLTVKTLIVAFQNEVAFLTAVALHSTSTESASAFEQPYILKYCNEKSMELFDCLQQLQLQLVERNSAC